MIASDQRGPSPADVELLDETSPASASPASPSPDGVVLRLFASAPTDRQAMVEAAARIPDLLLSLDAAASDGRLRRLCVLLPLHDSILGAEAGALAETLVRYGAGHLAQRPVQVNLVRHPPTPEGERRAEDMVASLFGGRLDGVRGQVFTLRDLMGEAP